MLSETSHFKVKYWYFSYCFVQPYDAYRNMYEKIVSNFLKQILYIVSWIELLESFVTYKNLKEIEDYRYNDFLLLLMLVCLVIEEFYKNVLYFHSSSGFS